MKNKTYRKMISTLLSMLMLAGNTPVYAEEESPSEETASEETVIVEEEQTAEENALPEEPAGETDEAAAFSGGDIELPELGDDPVTFSLPEELQVPIWSSYELKNYTLQGASIKDIVWTSADPYADNMASVKAAGDKLIIETKMNGDLDLTGTVGGQSATMRVSVSAWYEGTDVSTEFTDATPKDIWLRTAGPVSGRPFTVTSGDENIVTAEKTDETDAEGQYRIRITPVQPGKTKLYMTVEDPNVAGETVTISCQDISYFSNDPLTAISLYDHFTGEELSVYRCDGPEDLFVRVGLTPETFNINDLEVTVSDEDFIKAEYFDQGIFNISVLGGPGQATVTFGQGDVRAVLTVIVGEEGPVFELPETLSLPVWYEKTYELPYDLADEYDPDDIVWSTADDSIAQVGS